MNQSPTRGGNSGQPILMSDQQGFDRRWFAPHLKAVYAKPAGTGGPLRTLLNTHGKTLPAGSCYSVGSGGHITGGGYGLLSRMHGLTIDHLTAVDVVTWDAGNKQATLRYVSNHSASQAERDLFWALTGAGGGNFGVIVRYFFEQLPDAPHYATLFALAWDWSAVKRDSFADLLQVYALLMPLLTDNEFTLLKVAHVSSKQLGMILQVASLPRMSYDDHCRDAANLYSRKGIRTV